MLFILHNRHFMYS